ncbi:MAG: phosphoglycerate kinase [Synergistaceae bacterium]|nr:phosphoglycerate kinase [Synergistaceae bacterium]
MHLRTFTPEEVVGKKVLLRVDFNVPFNNGEITDNKRIVSHIATIKTLLDAGAKVALLSHLGRPEGTRNFNFSLEPMGIELARITGWNVNFVHDCIGQEVKKAVLNCNQEDILLLENVRFYPEEGKNDLEFAIKLAENFDIFVMDAFSVAHRPHASTVAITKILPTYAGNLMQEEIKILSSVRDNPVKPFILILGGAKVTDKIGAVKNLMKKVDSILIGGGMAFTFLKASGCEIGKSLCDYERLDYAKDTLKHAKEQGVKILLPVDVVVANECNANSSCTTVSVDEIPLDKIGLDIGPRTVELFSKEIELAKTVLWNGPMGVFEIKNFSKGTKAIALLLGDVTRRNGAFTLIGGGDSAAAVTEFQDKDIVSHVSSGGGASLEFFEGKMLPGIEPLILN